MAKRRNRRLSNSARRARAPKPPTGAAILLLRVIRKRMDLFNEAVEELLGTVLDDIAGTNNSSGIQTERTDALTPFIQRRLESLELRIARIFQEDELSAELKVIGERVSKHNGDELRRVIGVDIRNADRGVGELIDQFRSLNVGRIKSLAGKQLVEITEILQDAETPNLRVEVVRDQIRKRFDVSKSRATLLARDQVLTLNAQVAKQRQTNLGIEEYDWTTSGDNKVRDEHEDRDGKRFRWDQPPEDGHPGEPIQCRCTAFPVLPELA